MSFEQVWGAIERHAGETFQQIRGGTFTYTVNGGSVVPDRTNRQLPKEHFRKALALAPFRSTSALQHLQGPSYLYAILMDRRIRPVWDTNNANWTSGPSTLAPGMLVNDPPKSAVDAPPPRERVLSSPDAFGRGMQRAHISDIQDVDPQTTAFVIACSGSKVDAGLSDHNLSSGLSVIDSLPDELARRLLEARASIRKHVLMNARSCQPSSGTPARSTRPRALSSSAQLAADSTC
jgi:hypothetical protein